MPIELDPETTKKLTASIQQFVADELDQDIGDLRAGTVLEYFLKEIGPAVYNQAIADAQAYFQARVADLEGACYQREFAYSNPAPDQAKGKKPKSR
jgi:uncharacterized protein (DUF2164 family)